MSRGPPEDSWSYMLWHLRHVTWTRFLSIIYAWKLVGEDVETKSGVIPLLCTIERPDMAAPSKAEFDLIFPCPKGDLNALMRTEPRQSAWAGQLTYTWLATQCRQLAASLSAIHRIAAIKVSNLPRFRFFRSARLANDVIKWLSSSEADLGSLVFSNFSMQPPSPAEAAPEYFIYLDGPKDHRKSTTNKQISHTSRSKSGPVENKSQGDESDMRRPGDLVLGTPPLPILCTSGRRPKDAEQARPQEAAPEDPRPKSSFRASKFQVWCFGTILLQLITWFLLGPSGIRDHRNIFAPPDGTSGFLEVYGPSDDGDNPSSRYTLRWDVKNLILRLQAHDDCTAFVKSVLDIILSRMLVIDAKYRASSHEISRSIQQLFFTEESLRYLRASRNS